MFVGPIRDADRVGIHAMCENAGCMAVDLNLQKDHVHFIAMIPSKAAISDLMGRAKGETSISLLKQSHQLQKYPYSGNRLWVKEHCVDTVRMDADMIRKYDKYQNREKRKAQSMMNF